MTRGGLCDECWETEKAAKGYDPETYAGAWYELLKSDEFIGKQVFPAGLPTRSDGGKKETVSAILGITAAKTIGIGWKPVYVTGGSILIKDYPIEIIRIEDTKDTYENDDIFTAKLFFYSSLFNLSKVQIPINVPLVGIKAKWEGIVNKKFAGVVPIIKTHLSELQRVFYNIINDKELIDNLSFLCRDVYMFGVRWMGPSLEDDDLKLRCTLRAVQEGYYLETETRTVRCAGVSQYKEVREYWRKAFTTLLFCVCKITEHIKASLTNP